MPSNKDMSEALMNQSMVLPPMRPTAPTSPSLATPTTRVESTKGAMIILMRLRNTVVMMEILEETEINRASSIPEWWRMAPATMPRTMAMMIYRVRRFDFVMLQV